MIEYYVHVKLIKPKKYNGVRKNRAITVYKKKNGIFSYISHELVDHNSCKGDEATANRILHNKYGYKWNPNNKGYTLLRNDIRLVILPTGVIC